MTQPVQLSPLGEVPEELCDDNPQQNPRIGVTVMARAGWMDSASEPGSCRTSLGEIYSFSNEFSQSFPVADIPSVPLP